MELRVRGAEERLGAAVTDMLVKPTFVESAGNLVDALGCSTVTDVELVRADPDDGPYKRPRLALVDDCFSSER